MNVPIDVKGQNLKYMVGQGITINNVNDTSLDRQDAITGKIMLHQGQIYTYIITTSNFELDEQTLQRIYFIYENVESSLILEEKNIDNQIGILKTKKEEFSNHRFHFKILINKLKIGN